ncbi:MAG: NAD(P)H-hydrate dehydratase [Phycisphaeraceae bacterium]
MSDLPRIADLPAPPARPAEGHKGTFGTVIVIGGSATMIGAPAIAARAAFRIGAGLVKLATDPAVLPFAITIEPGATGLQLFGSLDDRLAALDAVDAGGEAILAVGPGLGQTRESADLLHVLLRGQRAMVLDADGLNLLARSGQRHATAGAPLVLTPHPGEFRRLAEPLGITASPTDDAQRPEAAAALAEAHRAVVVLKGRRTVVCDGRRVYVNTSGHSALATAGSGDVLTGVIAGLMGQGMTAFDAAVLGVHVHGLAAERWVAAHGQAGLRALDLCDHLPVALDSRRR